MCAWSAFFLLGRRQRSSCPLDHMQLLDLKQGLLGDGPAVQHLPPQHTLPPPQHFALLPFPQQVWLLWQHTVCWREPHGVWPLGQGCWGSGSGLPAPQEALLKPKEASTTPPTAVHTSLSVCRLEMGRAIIRDTSSRNALIGFLLIHPPRYG